MKRFRIHPRFHPGEGKTEERGKENENCYPKKRENKN